MTRIIAFVLRAGGAVGGGFAARYVPPETLTTVLADAGIGPEGGLTPATATLALCALGALFGFLFGSTVAGIFPSGSREPVGTREEAAASVPRLRRHLSSESGKSSKSGSPLDRLSAPPAGQQLPKHDLSHIPPAPQDDEITFDRIPNTGFYADIESPMNFDDDEDLARFARAHEEQVPRGPVGDDDSWGDDAGWDEPATTPLHESSHEEPVAWQREEEQPPQPSPEVDGWHDVAASSDPASIDDEWKAQESRSAATSFDCEWDQQEPAEVEMPARPIAVEEPTAPAEDHTAQDQWPEGIPIPPTLEEQGWGAHRSATPAEPQAEDRDFPITSDDVQSGWDEPEAKPASFLAPDPEPLVFDEQEEEPVAFHDPDVQGEQAPVEPAYLRAVPDTEQQVWAQPEPQSAPNLHHGTGHDGHSAPRFAPGLTGGMDNDWFAGEADEEEDADDDGAGYGSLMAIGLGKTHQPRPKAPTHRLGEANLSHMPLLDGERDAKIIPRGAGPQDFRLREALEELKRV